MKDNCFNEVRLVLASMVMVSHAQILSGKSFLGNFSLLIDPNFAVKGFFVISGYLVTKSYFSSFSIAHYIEKRARRVLPGYFTVIMFCLILGGATSNLNTTEFVSSPESIKYIFVNFLFLNFLQPTLPGVFSTNPEQAMNGSLWTIKIEIALYMCLPFIVFFFKKFGETFGFFIIFLCGVLWFTYFTFVFDSDLGPKLGRQFPGQLPFFITGCLLAQKSISQTKLFILFLPCALCLLMDFPEKWEYYVNMLIYPIIVIFICKLPNFKLNFTKKVDLSYGIYLFHYPVVQLIVYLQLYEKNVWVGFFMSIIITILLASLSWTWIEKRFLIRN